MTTSLDNSRRLYELSGFAWVPRDWHAEGIPAYDSGYLLRKLPSFYFVYCGKSGDLWYPAEMQGGPTMKMPPYIYEDQVADTPENALCLLAIKLFEQKILVKEQV